MSRVMSWLAENRCFALLVSLVAILVLGPTLNDTTLDWLLVLFHSAIGIAALVAVSYRRGSVIVGFIIGAPYFLAAWAHVLFDYTSVDYIHEVSGVLFYMYVMFSVLQHVGRGPIRHDDLYGAIAAYILLGLAWCYIYAIVQRADAEAFLPGEEKVGYLRLVYFSFTTLTTLGYGDITPKTEVAQSLAILEAITGMMFIAIFVARLLASYTRQKV